MALLASSCAGHQAETVAEPVIRRVPRAQFTSASQNDAGRDGILLDTLYEAAPATPARRRVCKASRDGLGEFGIWTSYRRSRGEAGAAARWPSARFRGVLARRLAEAVHVEPLLAGTAGSRLRPGSSTSGKTSRRSWPRIPGVEAPTVGGCSRDRIGHPETTAEYTAPMAKMRSFLDGLDGASEPVPRERRCPPRWPRECSAEPPSVARHAHLSSRSSTRAETRERLGPGPLIAAELACVLESDAERRALPRAATPRDTSPQQLHQQPASLGFEDSGIARRRLRSPDRCGVPAVARTDRRGRAGAPRRRSRPRMRAAGRSRGHPHDSGLCSPPRSSSGHSGVRVWRMARDRGGGGVTGVASRPGTPRSGQAVHMHGPGRKGRGDPAPRDAARLVDVVRSRGTSRGGVAWLIHSSICASVHEVGAVEGAPADDLAELLLPTLVDRLGGLRRTSITSRIASSSGTPSSGLIAACASCWPDRRDPPDVVAERRRREVRGHRRRGHRLQQDPLGVLVVGAVERGRRGPRRAAPGRRGSGGSRSRRRRRPGALPMPR